MPARRAIKISGAALPSSPSQNLRPPLPRSNTGSNAGESFARRNKLLALWALIGVAAIYLYKFNPQQSGLYLSCPFHALTGYSCPGCGTTRALHQLLHGHLPAACKLNPLMIASLPFIGYTFVSYSAAAITGRRVLPRVFIPANFIWLLLVVVLAYWLLRNMPFYPLKI